MTNCIFYTIIFVLFLNISFGSLRFSQVNRSFMSIYKGMLEASVITVDENGESTLPYYDEHAIDTYVNEYLKREISNYVTNYDVNISYINKDTNEVCLKACHALNITLDADINYFYKYHKTQTFIVASRGEV